MTFKVRRDRSPITIVTSPQATAAAPSVSAALGRIIDQLSPTAWLPAGVLVADLALTLAYATRSGDPAQRWAGILATLNEKPFGVILGVLFGLAVATVLTQSLGFASIRLFEGYWGASWLASAAATLGIGWQSARRWWLGITARWVQSRALRSAIPAIRSAFADHPKRVRAIEALARRHDTASFKLHTVRNAQQYIDSGEWLDFVPPRIMHRVSALSRRDEEYPQHNRMMPTRLGLALRTAEDQLVMPRRERNLRGFVIRHLAHIEPKVLAEHDEHRNRLDMYAVMSVVALTVIPFNAAVLWHEVRQETLIVLSVSAIAVAWASYRGAVAAAEEYGEALIAIDDAMCQLRALNPRAS